jgi:membrane-associated phospholipid phosphatase
VGKGGAVTPIPVPDPGEAPPPPARPATFARLAERVADLLPDRYDDPARSLIGQVEAVDQAIYASVAVTPTPDLDRDLRRLSDLADHSKIWVGVAGVIALVGGRRGRRAAIDGLASVAMTSLVANALVKPVAQRDRPDRVGVAVPAFRHVDMPTSRSFPSGHTASAFAFAVGASRDLPVLALPLLVSAGAVGYSRVHTGVHFPLDVVAGALLGAASGQATSAMVGWIRRHRG